MTGNNFSKSPVKSGGLSIFCRKNCGQYKRTCVQDAIINAAKFYGYNIRRELKKKIPHVIGEDVDINKAMKEKCVKDILFFTPIPISNKKHGAEYYVFTKLLDSFGLYIITCTNTNYETNINENHAFVLDARFRDYKKKLKGAIIDNQYHTGLYALEKEKDLISVESKRNICNYLFGGKTIFRTCHLIDVKRKQSQETKLKYQHVVERDCTKDTNEKDWNLFS